MVPALIDDKYVIRFAICAQKATEEDMVYAWRVISETATEVIEECDKNQEEEKNVIRLSLEIPDDQREILEELVSDAINVFDREGEFENEVGGGDDEEENAQEDPVFLYDNNIPSVPSIPNPLDRRASLRRRSLLRQVSDPKFYNRQVIRSVSMQAQSRRRSSSRQVSVDDSKPQRPSSF